MDDISVIAQGEFSIIEELVNVMARHYPKMPLNIQLSFGYSRYLDLHIYNVDSQKGHDAYYSPCCMLAYKELSSFDYTSQYSNISSKYKHAVVSTSLYRIHGRNSLQEDIDHHLHFMWRLLKHRDMDQKAVSSRVLAFFQKKRGVLRRRSGLRRSSRMVIVEYDAVSRRHCYLRQLLIRSFKSPLKILYKSGLSIGSILCPKRKVLRYLSKRIKL